MCVLLSDFKEFYDHSEVIFFQTFSVQLKDDDIPESLETFEIRLVNTTTEDNIVGTTNTSGASIDEAHHISTVTVKENDFPFGLLQFSTSLVPPQPDDPVIPPSTEKPVVC